MSPAPPPASSPSSAPHDLPELEAARLRLVPYGIGPATAAVFSQITTDPAVYWWRDTPLTVEQQTAHFESGALFADAVEGMGYWAVFPKDADTALGQVILQPLQDSGLIEIGWHFLKSARGHGYATEAGARLLAHGFDHLKIETIYAVIRPSNGPSVYVAQRIGMQADGHGVYYGIRHMRFRLTQAQHDAFRKDSAP